MLRLMYQMTHDIRHNVEEDLKDVKGGFTLFRFCVWVAIFYMVHGIIFLTFYLFYFAFFLLVYLVLKVNKSFEVHDEDAISIIERSITKAKTG